MTTQTSARNKHFRINADTHQKLKDLSGQLSTTFSKAMDIALSSHEQVTQTHSQVLSNMTIGDLISELSSRIPPLGHPSTHELLAQLATRANKDLNQDHK